jgi:hypothetical protein
MKTITLTYSTDDELKRKLLAIYMSLQEWTPYAVVRKRFALHLSPSAFSMRLARFEKRGGTFPKQMGAAGFKILQLKVTPELAEELAK